MHEVLEVHIECLNALIHRIEPSIDAIAMFTEKVTNLGSLDLYGDRTPQGDGDLCACFDELAQTINNNQNRQDCAIHRSLLQ